MHSFVYFQNIVQVILAANFNGLSSYRQEFVPDQISATAPFNKAKFSSNLLANRY